MRKPPVQRLIWFQIVVLGSICLIAGLLAGEVVFYSAILGALLAMMPQVYFSHRVFRYRGAKYSREVLKSFYIGEAIKWLMTIAGFIIVFSLVHRLHFLVFMCLFMAGQLLCWFFPLLLKQNLPMKQVHQ